MAGRNEKKESLWLLAASPAVWAAHFMLCYLTAAVWCAKLGGQDGSFGVVRWAIAGYTLLAIAAIGWIGWIGHRKARLEEPGPPRHADSPESSRRFLGLSVLLLSALSVVATLYAALVAVFIWNCD